MIMFCTQCGKEIADNSKFCSECGKSTSTESTPALGARRTSESPSKEFSGALSSFISRVLAVAVGIFLFLFLALAWCNAAIENMFEG